MLNIVARDQPKGESMNISKQYVAKLEFEIARLKIELAELKDYQTGKSMWRQRAERAEEEKRELVESCQWVHEWLIDLEPDKDGNISFTITLDQWSRMWRIVAKHKEASDAGD